MSRTIWLGLDVGKTKVAMVAFAGDDLGEPVAKHVLPADCNRVHETTESLLQPFSEVGVLRIGVASFGPLGMDAGSPEYGSIVNPSVRGWAGANVCRSAMRFTDHPVQFDLDVVAGGVAELAVRPERDELFYLSVGTGIGGSWVRTDRPPTRGQFGHSPVHRQAGDTFAGSCLFHGDCLQGLASGAALAARWGPDFAAFAAGHPAWELESQYITDACVTASFLTGCHLVVLGGGVSQHPSLVEAVARNFASATASFDSRGFPSTLQTESRPVQLARFGRWSVAVGAALLAREGLGMSFY